MTIVRRYETERDCAKLWIREDFSHIPEFMVVGFDDGYPVDPRWRFIGVREGYDEESGEYKYGPVHKPMWTPYFFFKEPLDIEWCYEHQEEVMDLGFILIFHEEEVMGLGINGAGYDFYDHFWVPLYRLRGFKWHE